jgi:general secretion pathway protein C
MVVYLKRYFWAVTLGFLALSATLSARVVNTFVGSALEPAPLLPGDATPRPASAASLIRPSLDVTKFGHLFGIEPPPPPPPSETKGPVDTTICLDCAPVKSSLRLQLLATMVASDKRWSMALVLDLDKQTSAYFFIGDHLKGPSVTVKEIVREPQRVIIINEETHRVEYIDGVPGSGAAAVNTAGLPNLGNSAVPPPGDGEAGPAGPDVPVEGIKKLGDNKYEISRGKLDSTLANLNEVATQARIVPSFKNGQANGFKLFSIRPGSLYSAIGIQNGDVITKINGYEMNSPEKALEIYTRLKDARNVKIEYERRGSMMSSEYNIQ